MKTSRKQPYLIINESKPAFSITGVLLHLNITLTHITTGSFSTPWTLKHQQTQTFSHAPKWSMLPLCSSSTIFSIHFISFVLFRCKSGNSPRSLLMASKHGHNLVSADQSWDAFFHRSTGSGKDIEKT